MRKYYSAEEKHRIMERHYRGESISAISKETGIARSTLYEWLKSYNATKTRPVNMSDYISLQNHCKKLESIISILKTCNCPINAPLHLKFETIKKYSSIYSVSALCSALNVAKGSYYNFLFRNKNGNTLAAKRREVLAVAIEKIFYENKQIFGANKITVLMNQLGYKTSAPTVAKIMHENGWFSIKSSAKTLYLQKQVRKENLLNQQFNPKAPNEVWVSDVTFFRLKHTKFYICAVLDLYARKLLSLIVSKRNSSWLTKTALMTAYKERKPDSSTLIFHSDRGTNYTSTAFANCINALQIRHSYSQKSRPYDNSVCESFFNTLKREELYRTDYKSEAHLRSSLLKYKDFYNNVRPHSYANNRTPNKAESIFFAKQSQ